MKVEFYGRYFCLTIAAATPGAGDWIEQVYHRRRRHFAVG